MPSFQTRYNLICRECLSVYNTDGDVNDINLNFFCCAGVLPKINLKSQLKAASER